jgi:hypothetical protein
MLLGFAIARIMWNTATALDLLSEQKQLLHARIHAKNTP